MNDDQKTIFDNDKVIDYIKACYHEADDARKRREDMWDKMLNEYRGEDTLEHVKNWMSKAHVPTLARYVKIATAILKRALIENPTWWDIDNVIDKESQTKANLIKQIVDFWLYRNKFFKEFSIVSKYGLLMGKLISKVFWMQKTQVKKQIDETGENTDIPITVDEIKIETIDPHNFYEDPTGNKRYVIQKIIKSLDEVYSNYNNGYYNDEVPKIQSDYKPKDQQKENVAHGVVPSTNIATRKMVTLWEFWGDIIDKDTNEVIKDQKVTIANETYMIRGPEDNPLMYARNPFIVATIDYDLDAIYPMSVFEDSLPLIQERSKFTRSLINGATLSSIPFATVDVNAIDDPDQLNDGLEPAKIFSVNGPNAMNVQHFEAVSQGNVSIFNLLSGEIQNTTGMNDSITGASISKRQTKAEVMAKMSQSNSLFDSYAKNIETEYLTELITAIYGLSVQFMGSGQNPSLSEILQSTNIPDLNAMSTDARMDLIRGNWKFRVSGISQMLNKQDKLQKMLQFLKVAGAIPQAIEKLNINEMLVQIALDLDIDIKKIMLSDQQVQQKQQAQMQQAQAMQAQQSAGPGPQKPISHPAKRNPKGGA